MKGNVTWRLMSDEGPCGIATDSTAYCWTGSDTPTPVGGSGKWTYIMGKPQRCALAPTGRVYCWTSTLTDPPVLVTGGPPVTSISVEMNFITGARVCGLSAAGDMYCVAASGTGSAQTLALQARDLGGLKLKRFWGECGIAFDDKVYCWNGDTNPVITLIPGQ